MIEWTRLLAFPALVVLLILTGLVGIFALWSLEQLKRTITQEDTS